MRLDPSRESLLDNVNAVKKPNKQKTKLTVDEVFNSSLVYRNIKLPSEYLCLCPHTSGNSALIRDASLCNE